MYKRKSTRIVTLALLGSAGLLSACSEPVPETPSGMFKDVSSCVAGGFDQNVCTQALADATADNQKNAPQFSQKAECEAQFGSGNCESRVNPTTGMADMFLPAMAGFLLGNTLGNMSNGSRGSVYPQAVYYDKDRRYVNSGGVFVSRNYGAMKVSPRSTPVGTSRLAPSTRTTTVERTTSYVDGRPVSTTRTVTKTTSVPSAGSRSWSSPASGKSGGFGSSGRASS